MGIIQAVSLSTIIFIGVPLLIAWQEFEGFRLEMILILIGATILYVLFNFV